MAKISRRALLAMLGAGGGLVGLGYVLRNIVGDPLFTPIPDGVARAQGPGMMGDMRVYMQMFNRHNEFTRVVENIPGGVRTTTESSAADLVDQLQAHVSAMYSRLDSGDEVMCMSASLPTLFRRAPDYHREITLTANGLIVEETADDPQLTQAIRDHAREVTGFVNDGMPAMMEGMMGNGMMGMG